MTPKEREEKAKKNFLDGYNCAQSVALAYSDLFQIEQRELLKISSSFGAGIGRLREVCGAVSGMAMVLGSLYGLDHPEGKEMKKEFYARLQEVGMKFEEENGSLVCRKLLGLKVQHEEPLPQERTEKYYQDRPCLELVGSAARILGEYLENELNDKTKA